MTESSTQASGAPPGSDSGLPDETLAALELGFRNLLIQLDPTLYSPKTPAVPTQKPDSQGTPSSTGRAVRGCELVFPTGNNIYNRVTDAPVKVMSLRMPDDSRKGPAPALGTTVGQTALLKFGTASGGVPSFVICDLGTREVLRGHPLLAAKLHTEPAVSTFPFRLADVPGRGKGLVASRRLKPGEFVLGEPPLLITPIRPAMAPDVVRAFEQAVERDLHPRARKALDALYACPADDPAELHQPGGARLSKLRTNSVELWFPMAQANQKLGGTFELISRVNHSCAPNLEFHWSIIDFQGSITAIEEIQPGEELTMNYLSNDAQKASRATRRAELWKKYKFKCACKKCGPV